MADWTMVRLEELAANEKSSISKPYGSAILKEDYRSDGVPVVRGVNLARGIFHDDDFVFIEDGLANQIPGAEMKAGDLVVTHRGTVGQVSMIPRKSAYERYVASTSHVKVRLDSGKAISEFYYYWFSSPVGKRSILENASAVGVPGIAQPVATVKRLLVPCPSLSVQRAIAEVLEALDAKVAANDTTRSIARELARFTFARAIHRGAKVAIRDVAQLVTRGITPKYVESDGVIVLNQKCVRDQRVNLTPSRRTQGSSVRPGRLLQRNDVLVNSTGVGTLGRVARWTQNLRATADSHITIVRFDSAMIDPVCAGFGLLRIEKEIEGLAEGSTGQTELRRDLLAGLEIGVPHKTLQSTVEAELTALDELALGLQRESDRLAATRDELLPLLMSGKIRVREAEKIVEGVV